MNIINIYMENHLTKIRLFMDVVMFRGLKIIVTLISITSVTNVDIPFK